MENMEKVVYLDNAATTPCAPEALEMMVKALSGACGNPSSHYSVGYGAGHFPAIHARCVIEGDCRTDEQNWPNL